MVGVWAELARQPDLREVYADGYIRVRGEIARVVRQWQGRGVIAGEEAGQLLDGLSAGGGGEVHADQARIEESSKAVLALSG